MHWVDRGPEPGGLGHIQQAYTPRWIQYYRNGTGPKPTDSRWRDFHNVLGQRFSGLCGYCECSCKGEVDHFRPKSRFPESVYEWSNWILACHDCNQAKVDKWPEDGYVDPCAELASDKLETYFTFDTKTGEIVPLKELDSDRWDKAQGMIEDLNLNAWHHLRARLLWIWRLAWEVPDDSSEETPDTEVDRHELASRTTPWSSITRAWLLERGYSVGN